jgi:ferredoxin
MNNERILKELSQNPAIPVVNAVDLDLMPLDGDIGRIPPIRPLTDEEKNMYEHSLDNVSALSIPKPGTKAEEAELVRSFLSGFGKMLSEDDNWTFWQPLMCSLENCVQCQACSDACPIYIASGRAEIYRPSYRAEIVRAIKRKYFNGSSLRTTGSNFEVNWPLVARLAELSYRCTLCRRCALVCPMGVDNGLITRELRKLFSQEMSIAPTELHAMGTMIQLHMPSGYTPDRFEQMIQVVESDIAIKTGKHISLPVDKTGADFLFIQTSLESPAWLKCPECYYF